MRENSVIYPKDFLIVQFLAESPDTHIIVKQAENLSTGHN